MEETTLVYTFFSTVLLITFTVAAFIFISEKSKKTNLPPSPIALPIIGHLHLLKQPIHRTLLSLSQKHGPVFSLWLGSRLVVVVSSPAFVEECFTKNDIVFANRPDFISGKYLSYGNSTLGAASYGDHWRNLRRLCNTEVFSSVRLNASANIRKEEIKLFLHKIYKLSATRGSFAKVQLKKMFSELTFNIIMRMVAGKRYYGDEKVTGREEAAEFRDLITELFAVGSYPGDFVPILQRLDFTQGYAKKAMKLFKKTDSFFQGLIDEQRNCDKNECSAIENTMIYHLLSLQQSQPDYYNDETIKGLIITMLSAATETSAVTLEWAMSNLLNNPSILAKAKAEMHSTLGSSRLIEETDLGQLNYLQNIISETFRLYPAAPLLAPHKSVGSCTVGGYDIPTETILMVNAWAIHRDPTLWEDSTVFKPERFEKKDADQPYKLMPFGLGRRVCPGSGMANRVVGLTLGSLIQCFDWKKVNEDEEIDMTEGIGLSMPKIVPLEGLCKPCPLLNMVFKEDAA